MLFVDGTECVCAMGVMCFATGVCAMGVMCLCYGYNVSSACREISKSYNM